MVRNLSGTLSSRTMHQIWKAVLYTQACKVTKFAITNHRGVPVLCAGVHSTSNSGPFHETLPKNYYFLLPDFLPISLGAILSLVFPYMIVASGCTPTLFRGSRNFRRPSSLGSRIWRARPKSNTYTTWASGSVGLTSARAPRQKYILPAYLFVIKPHCKVTWLHIPMNKSSFMKILKTLITIQVRR